MVNAKLKIIGVWFIESLGKKKSSKPAGLQYMNIVMINNRCRIHRGRDIRRRRLCCSRRRRLS